ncbi:MAG: hypothetical protein N2111_05320 [Candidatus Sumerlaeaceae bacterium]|nr:hypothetical protein [Candidatus Sumerlaeaceae bacterium]
MRLLARGQATVCAAGVLALFFLTVRAADARAYIVTTTSDVIAEDGQVSLREAMLAADKNVQTGDAEPGAVGYDSIRFSPSLADTTVTLSSALSTITEELSISGLGATATVISGNDAVRPFGIAASTSVTLADLTIARGHGGAIRNNGRLSLQRVVLRENTNVTSGGGLLNNNYAVLDSCVLTSNAAPIGGAVANVGGLYLSRCTVSSNQAITYGGGLWSSGRDSIASLVDCTISLNSAHPEVGYGGGLALYDGGSCSLDRCNITSNTASTGGGLLSMLPSALAVRDSLIAWNRAEGASGGLGGGVALINSGNASFVNCTISSNRATNDAGGMYNMLSAARLDNATVYGNTSSGLSGGLRNDTGNINLSNTIVAGNGTTTGTEPDISGPITSHGYNLIGSLGTNAFPGNIVGDQYGDPYNTTAPNPGAYDSPVPIDPRLRPLADNGGPTLTHMPDISLTLAGYVFSPALERGNPATKIPADQRGVSRPQGSGYDVGAVEAFVPDLDVYYGSTHVLSGSTGLNLGTHPVGENREVRFSVGNVGSAPWHFFTFSRDSQFPMTDTLISLGPSLPIEVGTSAILSLRFKMASVGVGLTTITLSGDDPDETPYCFQVFARGCILNPVVTTLADSGPGSLRQAIADACPGSVITFDRSLIPRGGSAVFHLTGGELVLNKELTIRGQDPNLIIIDADRLSRVFRVTPNTSVTLERITCTDGRSSGMGGCVFTEGRLTVRNARVCYGSSVRGAGIAAVGQTLRMIGTIVDHCEAQEGGGIYLDGADSELILTNSSISENSARSMGGGLSALGASLLIQDSLIISNFAEDYGGGLNTQKGAQGLIDRVTIAENQAGTNSTQGAGGADIRDSQLTIRNCTISGNSARSGAGGMWFEGSLTSATLQNCTVTANGLEREAGAEGSGGIVAVVPVSCVNSLIAANTEPGEEQPDINGRIESQGFNLIGNVGRTDFATNTEGDQYGDPLDSTKPNPGATESPSAIDPLLNPLGYSVGALPVHTLNSASPALDAGDYKMAPDVDQRGVARPQGGQTDIGAVEMLYALSVSKSGESETVYCGYPIRYTVTVQNDGEVDARGVTTVDDLPESASILSVSSSHLVQVLVHPHGVRAEWLNAVEPGTTRTLWISVFPREAGQLINRARVESSVPDTSPEDNETSCVTTVLEPFNAYDDDSFTTGMIWPPGSLDGWGAFGFNTPGFAWPDWQGAQGAYAGNIVSHPTRFRVTGVIANWSEWLPYSMVGPDRVARAKYYVYAGGQPNAGDFNQIPNLRMRLLNRFAVNSMLEVFHHTGDNPAQTAMDQELRPSTDAGLPSMYRVDLDPVDVPYLAANAATEGITRAFEAYAIHPQDTGYVAMTESLIGTYPVSLVAPAAAPIKTYDAADLAVYNPLELSLFNLIPGTQEGEFGLGDALTSPPTYSQSPDGVTLDTGNVPTDRIGLGCREFNPDRNTMDYPSRVRVEAGKQYVIRWHLTSTQQVNRQAQIRMRARSVKFAWSQKLEVGGAWGTGGGGMYPLNANNSIAQQALPGVGTQNPDKYTTETAGGWYTMMFHTPMSLDIRPEFLPVTPLSVRMPNICGQPGPGVNAFSRRDVFLGLDLVDTISGGAGRTLEAGHVTADRVEMRAYMLVPD